MGGHGVRHEDAQLVSEQLREGVFLVVDDFDAMRRIVVNQLRDLGARNILEAGNGAEALKLLQASRVTMVLSDWNMPVMDGLELLRAVRNDPRLAALPFLMVTAEVERDRVEQAIQAGVSELLVKPYTSAGFVDRLTRTMARKARAAAPAEPAPAEPAVRAPAQVPCGRESEAEKDRPTVLMVDDTPDNLMLLSRLFKDEYRVKIAHNGDKALAISQGDAPPDLILLDIMMPGMDGFEVARRLREHPSSEHIPIIFVTAMDDDASWARGLELGAVDFVTKPVDPGTLRMRVQNFMRYVRLHRNLQADYDNMLEVARLKEQVERVTRHDLKGALAGIVALSDSLIEHSNLRSEQCDQLRLIEESALRVLDTINLSAEIYRIESGRFTLRPKPVPLLKILGRLVAMSGYSFAGKELEFDLVKPDDSAESVFIASGDPVFCHSLLQNLVKNACEAAPAGSRITLALSLVGDDIAIAIENRGVVPQAIRGQFFDKYATSGKDNGTGLGTYSAKLLTEAQGGSIQMETHDASDRTRITVRLPRVSAA